MKQSRKILRRALLIPTTLVTFGMMNAAGAVAQIYNPIEIAGGREISDTLSENDIPTGVGGFARDYSVELFEGDQITIDVISEEFDTLVSLIGDDGTTVSENDDGPDGSTNSLLFARISKSGQYTVRVRSYAGQGAGAFSLKLARLREIEE
ncbi:peptidase [Leptolyngbyaceae cyanobacterium CCMR0082]|uniref:Peptidase n=2 Tax=Adonisia turfae TaxID=2950184 RepID=A0A6M0SF33_9CYAN|nr:PPC domain-containing protein [Adonisia turfae]EKV02366.1 pre-peptidase C family protein [Leptolyngbya sp. PCC 7375]MDV3351315.1 PPC domain-containing protein [Leptothoe sp. LEGE 181152]NEZ60226.1 peptidase [Adonisia turfae CCMR0081]NEZ66252.1 peptidase [Adonisia turfae CCMR0082]